jgi:hypothetical protein
LKKEEVEFEKSFPCCDDETSAFESKEHVLKERKDIPAG